MSNLTKPCPDLPKGVRCPLCGGTWACLQPERRKVVLPSVPKEKK